MIPTTRTAWRRAGLRLADLGTACALIAACALILALAGCGGDDTPRQPTQGNAAPEGAGGAHAQTPIASCTVCQNTQLDCAP